MSQQGVFYEHEEPGLSSLTNLGRIHVTEAATLIERSRSLE